MPRPLTIAALLPALGAATAAWAQGVPQDASQTVQSPYPSAAYGRPLSWPGRAQNHPSVQSAPAYPTAAADSFAPPPEAAYAAAPVVRSYAPSSVARPPVIPHGGYPWRAGAPGYSRQLTPAQTWGAPPPIPAPPPSANALTPAPDFRPVTSHPDATWGPYVAPPGEPPAPAYTPPAPYQPTYQPAPWARQPLSAQPQPVAPPPTDYAPAPHMPEAQPQPQPMERAPAPSHVPWTRPQPQPEPQPAPPVQRTPAPEPTPAPMPESVRPMPTPAPVQPAPRAVAPAPAPQPVPQPAPAPILEPAPPVQPPAQPPVQPAPHPMPAPVPADPAFDPMAPRRDAPIFQLQRNTPQPAAPAPAPAPAPPAPNATPAAQPAPQPAPQPVSDDAPAQGGARYYSVHRQAGRQPDATPLPAPNYLDALPVELDQPIASDDLAQPPEAPAVMRDAQGRLRAAPMADDPVTDGPMLP